MALFNYIVRDELGKKLTGRVESRDERQAVKTLRERSYTVIKLVPVREGMEISFLTNLTEKVSKNDLVTFTQQLSTMLNSGLPLTDGLDLLRVQSKPGLAKILGEIIKDVQGGVGLGEALGRHNQVFSPVYVSLVKSGEASGKLDVVLERLAQNEEKRREFRAKTKGALVYPAIVVVAMIVVVSIMLIFVVPQMTSMYESFGAELPLITKILIGISNLLRSVWWLVLLGLGGGVFALKQWQKTETGNYKIDKFLLSIPIYGVLRTQIILTEFAMTLSLLVGAGISILEALDIVKRAMDSIVFEKAIDQVMKGVEKGLPMGTMLARQTVFPALLPQMVSVGEETGELEAVLLKVARYFETNAEQAIKNLTTAIEPLIMIVLGVVVGFIVLAIITPLYKITELF